jgi:hypothetical protein
MKTATYFATRINALTTKSASSIIEIGSSFLEAKHELSPAEYRQFLFHLKYVEGSASIRKWNKIGEASIRLRLIENRLPIQWTTIYEIARLSQQKFDELMQSSVLCQAMTAKKMSEFFSNQVSKKSKPRKVHFTLTFEPDVDPLDLLQKINELQSASSIFNIEVSHDAQELIEIAQERIYKQAA